MRQAKCENGSLKQDKPILDNFLKEEQEKGKTCYDCEYLLLELTCYYILKRSKV